MARSLKKGPFVEPKIFKKVKKWKESSKQEPIKTWSRRSTILPDFVGVRFAVHNGKDFIPLTVREEMVGHKFGEFSPTRHFRGHPGTKAAAQAEGGKPTTATAPAAKPAK